MQGAPAYRTNRNLFSNYYLDEHLPESTAWDDVSEGVIRAVFDEIESLVERERANVENYNEAELEEEFIKPVLRALDVTFSVQATVVGSGRRPDYAFFGNDDARQAALDHRKKGGDFYRDAIAVADAKRWGRPLDTRGNSKYDFENPSYQIHVYLQETPTEWAVLTDGRRWRLYYGPTSHRLDSYYEVDLLHLLETGDREAFKYFYYFFRREAFLDDASGECFLDEVLEGSTVFAQELGEDLQDNIYEAITVLSEGFLTYSGNDLDAGDLNMIHDSALVYLYRLIFVFYAESEGRELLPTENTIYADSYSLNDLKGRVADELSDPNPKYRDWQTGLADRLDELFALIDRGSEERGIPEEDLFVPAYNGGLFRTRPEPDAGTNEESSREARFLRENRVGDAHLARVIDLLARSRTGTDDGGSGGRSGGRSSGRGGNESAKAFVDYSSLDERHLGSIYEGLLEYRLHVADEPLAIEDGEYVPVGEGESGGSVETEVEAGEVYLTTDSGERKATGSYYTPEYVVEYIVENTLGPLVREIREDLLAGDPFGEAGEGGGFAAEFAERVFDLKVLDPAMGSGHFLVNAIDYLAREIIDAQERQAAQEGIETVAEGRDINWARRQVAQRCIYGVDINPLATELAKVSLWLRTLAAKQPLAFLDHHLKTGNSLVGSDIEEIDALEAETGGDNGPNATLADFGAVRRGTIDHLMDVYQAFIAIENRDLADAKEMERKYHEIERDALRNRLVGIANAHTAEDFGLEVPGDAYERMARGLSDDDEWNEISGFEWYRDAQRYAGASRYFHWKLEFPEAFYRVDGSEQENPGFDAVIGNPPYVRQEKISEQKPAFEQHYSRVYHGIADMYVYFFNRSHELLKHKGEFGFVTTNRFLTAKYGEKLRKYLSEVSHVRIICDFGDLPVFKDATTYPAIFITTKTNNGGSTRYARVPNLDFSDLSAAVEEYGFEIAPEGIRGSKWSLSDTDRQTIFRKIDRKGVPLKQYLDDAEINYGIKTGYNEAFIIDKQTRDGLISSDEVNAEIIKPFISGEDVRSHYIRPTEEYIIFAKRGIEIDEYPEIKEYLAQFKRQLRPRPEDWDGQNEWPGRKAGPYEWYEIQDTLDYSDQFDSDKIVFPEVSQHTRFSIDENSLYPNKTVFILPEPDFFLVAVLNSSLLELYLHEIASMMRGGYYMNSGIYVNQLPIHGSIPDNSADVLSNGSDRIVELCEESIETDELTGALDIVKEILAQEPPRTDTVKRSLALLAQNIADAKGQFHSFNLDLFDYLGTYDDGQALADLYQPPSGLADSMLAATTTEYEKLRLGRVTVAESGGKLVVRATARYKPENPDEYETDRWGYTETDFEPVMEFVGLSDAERALISEFVPYAADEAGGFADFRENATKTKSILDRLEALTLPAIDDVESGLERYLRTKQRAEELDEKIERTDELIDQIVYRLYGLTDEEIEIVEESVGR